MEHDERFWNVSQAFKSCVILALCCVKGVTWSEGRRAAVGAPGAGRDVTRARGAAEGVPRPAGAHAPRRASRWPSQSPTPSECPRCIHAESFLSLLHKLLVPAANRYSLERGYRPRLTPGGLYDSTLWTPTLVVHHLLSQSLRLTRRIDMRQARDIVSSWTPNICRKRKIFQYLSVCTFIQRVGKSTVWCTYL